MLTDCADHALVTLRSSLGDVLNAVQAAESLLHAGGAVDLAGTDSRIELLCAQALDLPPPMARAILPDLLGLRSSVETLIEALTRRPAR
jgi:hypothetical protein